MCRFNIIYVKGEKAQEYLAQKGYGTFGEFGEDWQGCQGYVYGACNCSSMVGSLDGQSGSSYDEMFKYKKEKELKRLFEIRELMQRPDYKTLCEEYQKAKQEIFDKMDELTAEVQELDLQMEEQLYRKYNGRIPAEESKKMCEELERRRSNIEASPEYKVLQERLDVLLREHLLLDESNGYYLTKEEQEEARAGLSLGGSDFFVPADEFVDFLAENEEALVGETKEELEDQFSAVFTAEEIGFAKRQKKSFRDTGHCFRNYWIWGRSLCLLPSVVNRKIFNWRENILSTTLEWSIWLAWGLTR